MCYRETSVVSDPAPLLLPLSTLILPISVIFIIIAASFGSRIDAFGPTSVCLRN
jgi:hypothetical protein